jgi:predicted phage terminase large subunit-like protein
LQDIVETQGSVANTRIYIEPKASGLAIVQQLKQETLLNVVELQAPKDSKITRVNAVTPKLEARRVKLLRGPYVENLLYQLATFPNAKHDDQVDVLVYAVNQFLQGTGRIRFVVANLR